MLLYVGLAVNPAWIQVQFCWSGGQSCLDTGIVLLVTALVWWTILPGYRYSFSGSCSGGQPCLDTGIVLLVAGLVVNPAWIQVQFCLFVVQNSPFISLSSLSLFLQVLVFLYLSFFFFISLFDILSIYISIYFPFRTSS